MFDDPLPHRPPDDPDELDAGLVALISHAWTRGWMPTDLIGAVAHCCRPASTRLAAALIRREHAERGYGDRLAPRWQRQLTDVEAMIADPGAVIAARRRGWRTDRLDLWGVLAFLPRLHRLGPLPGEADPAAEGSLGAADRTASSPDPGLLRRVRALLAKAESSEFDAEAEAFTAKAQALIATYSLADALEHGDTIGSTNGPASIRLMIERPYPREKFMLLGVVARANRCRSILHDGLGLATVIGYPIDGEATELLFTSLLVQASHAMQRHGSTTDAWGTSTTKSFRRSFLQGFAERIGERLAGESDTVTAETAASSPSLLPALAGRAAQVDRTVDEVFPELSRLRPSRAAFDGSGYLAGVAAADRADLAARRRLAS